MNAFDTLTKVPGRLFHWWRLKQAQRHLNTLKIGTSKEYQRYLTLQVAKSVHKSSKDAAFRYQPFVERLAKLPGARQGVLCVGCRNAYELSAFAERGWRRVVGIDLFSNDPRVLVMDMHQMTFPDNSFAVVYSGNSFEHTYDPHLAAKEFCRVVRDGGYVAIDTPIGFTPDSVDRWDIGSLERLKTIFASYVKQLTTVWSQSTSQNVRVIFKAGKR